MKEELNLKDIVNSLPNTPGVYQYFDSSGKIIYVGKAKNLKSRVSSYFNSQNQHSAKTSILVKQIVDLKTINVDSEMDALLLENSLIKKYQPKYNIQLKDDKTYPWICIKNEPFPRVFYTRQVIKDKSEYFGPFHSVKMIRTLLDLFNNTFEIRNCSHKLTETNIGNREFKTAVEYYIGNCKGCCQGEISTEEYDIKIQQIKKILKGNVKLVIDQLKEKMTSFAQNYEFEKAQDLKERIALVEKYQAKSAVVSASLHNLDVFGIEDDINSAFVNFFKVMNGAIIQSHTVELKKKLNEDTKELLQFAITEIRLKFASEAKEMILPFEIDLPFEGVKITVPQKGEKKDLLDLSTRNARFYKMEKNKQIAMTNPEKHVERILESMKADLRLTELPHHIECFDNSNFHGTNAVAACVVFKDGKPAKKEYRHFNIKTVVGPDDFASMEEVVLRRYKRLLEEDAPLPQLIIIDGGKGQLSSAVKSLKALDLFGKIAIIGIAKKLEEIYFPGDSIPIYIDKRSETLKVIQNARNEAHRFGITHHRDKRSKNFIQSEIIGINGIGEHTMTQLLKDFKSVSKIKEASLESLVASIGTSKATIVFQHFKTKINE
jgi:excinuclease ABC subunit C